MAAIDLDNERVSSVPLSGHRLFIQKPECYDAMTNDGSPVSTSHFATLNYDPMVGGDTGIKKQHPRCAMNGTEGDIDKTRRKV